MCGLRNLMRKLGRLGEVGFVEGLLAFSLIVGGSAPFLSLGWVGELEISERSASSSTSRDLGRVVKEWVEC